MTTIPVRWIFNTRGFWDHGMLMRLADGNLWRTAYDVAYQHYEKDFPPHGQGAVAVLSARHAVDKVAEVQAEISRLDWCIFIVASDEEGVFPWRSIRHPRMKVYVQTPRPGIHDECDFKYVTGPRVNTTELLRHIPQRRKFLWAYSGQEQNPMRQQCVLVLRDRIERKGDGILNVTDGFGRGYEYVDYLQVLSDAKIAPCPPGSFVTDCFRVYESLEAGTLPVATSRSPADKAGFEYWEYTSGGAPFPRVSDWNDFAAIANRGADDPLWLQNLTNQSIAWWLNYKRDFAYRVADDAYDFMNTTPELASAVTILISTSPIPSHPDTRILDDCIARLRAYPELSKAEIILMFDGVNSEHKHLAAAYAEYTQLVLDKCRLDPAYASVVPLVFNEHMHQAEMTRAALLKVKTPLIFFVEHDTYPQGQIDFGGIANVLLHDNFTNCIRLHLFDRVLDEHKYLYTDCRVNDVMGVPLIKTTAWSQRPHMARTDWYRALIDSHVEYGKRMWIEHAVYGPMSQSPWEKYRVTIYAPPGDMTRSGHSDGRRAN